MCLLARGASSQKGEEIPEDAWEYHSRKAKNDAVYRGLQVRPAMPRMRLQTRQARRWRVWARVSDDRSVVKFRLPSRHHCTAAMF